MKKFGGLCALLLGGMAACAQNGQTAKTDPSGGETLVVYFSATGTTRSTAETLHEVVGGDVREIEPETPYTNADLDWRDRTSRSTLEMKDDTARPAIRQNIGDIDKYDVVYIGYPIWWNLAPRAVNTWMDTYAREGVAIIPFATSGGSGIENSVIELRKTYPNLTIKDGKLLNYAGKNQIGAWVESIK